MLDAEEDINMDLIMYASEKHVENIIISTFVCMNYANMGVYGTVLTSTLQFWDQNMIK